MSGRPRRSSFDVDRLTERRRGRRIPVRNNHPQHIVTLGRLGPRRVTISQNDRKATPQLELIESLECLNKAGTATALDLQLTPITAMVLGVALVSVVELHQRDLEPLRH